MNFWDMDDRVIQAAAAATRADTLRADGKNASAKRVDLHAAALYADVVLAIDADDLASKQHFARFALAHHERAGGKPVVQQLEQKLAACRRAVER